jgi:uncharacterized protein YndB with AHSA1/START domain
MDTVHRTDTGHTANPTTAERKSDREFVVTRRFNAPARIVWKAWTTPELLKQWWTPKSYGITFISCEVDARTGGKYRFVFSHASSPEPMAFFGKYIEATPHSRLVWTNEEGEEPGAVTTVTFEEKDGTTLVTLHDLYPTKEALDEAMVSGSTGGHDQSFRQLDEVLGTQPAAA